jgi:serine phosphatase RsbU (regulator of sigma subunit)
MAEVRTALRAYSLLRLPLDATLSLLNRMMQETAAPPVTLSLFALDLDHAELTAVNAGPPPGLLLCPDGTREFVAAASGPPLGRRISSGYRVETLAFPAGSSLVLYTDGLIERRDEPIDAGLARLRTIDLDQQTSLPLAHRVLTLLNADEPAEDDVAILAIETR